MRNRIKVYLAEHGMTQEQLGKSIGVCRQAISKIITGENDPTSENMLKIAWFFEDDPRNIFFLDEPFAPRAGKETMPQPIKACSSN